MSRAKALPYENATSGRRALVDLQAVVERLGADRFGCMTDYGRDVLIVHFVHRGRTVQIEASIAGYAAAWLRAHPWSRRQHVARDAYEQRARRVAAVAVQSILRDWIKGQITAIECGLVPFEAAFLGHVMLPNGQTVYASAAPRLLGKDGE